MKLDGAVALVTGANRGLGRSLVTALAQAGVPRIYAGARGPFQLPDFGSRTTVLPLELDTTDDAQVARAASHASDTTLFINNAGLLPRGGAMSVSEQDLSAAKPASWAMTQSFRDDLAGTRVRVVACFPGGIDTEMLEGVPAAKAHPDSVASSIVEAIMRGETEVFPDDVSAVQGPTLLGIDGSRGHLKRNSP